MSAYAPPAELLPRLREMLRLQEQMNRRVHPQWREQGRAWHRALWSECAELLEYCNWKWWREQPVERAQIQLEVVDLWHFGMSAVLNEKTTEEAARELGAIFSKPPQTMEVIEATEALALHALRERTFSAPLFHALMGASGMDFEMLFRQYVGKNVLNLFRQDHGYRQGDYRKTWDGREDNQHLAELALELDAGSADFANALYASLEQRYQRTGTGP